MANTFAEKLLSARSGRTAVKAGDIVRVNPDRLMASGSTSAISIHCFRQLGARAVFNPDQIVFILDHETPAHSTGHSDSHQLIRAFAQEQGISRFFDVGV